MKGRTLINYKDRMINYLSLFTISFFLFGCSNTSEDLTTVHKSTIELGAKPMIKTLEVEWPIAVSFVDNLASWRCTPNQPYCKTYGNDQIEFTLCHIYTYPQCSYLIKSESDKEYFKSGVWNSEIKEQSMKYKAPNESQIFPTIIQEVKDGQILQHGFVINWEFCAIFKKYYSWNTAHEHLSLEVSAKSDKPLDHDSYADQISFIVSRIKGIPVQSPDC